MNHAQPRQYFAATQRAVANADAIEWEELPSLLASSLAQRLVTRSRWEISQDDVRGANDSQFQGHTLGGTPWDNTMPADLDPAPVSQPYLESLDGLVTREVHEPDVFHHFFGPNAAR
jgi:hypothetical protein